MRRDLLEFWLPVASMAIPILFLYRIALIVVRYLPLGVHTLGDCWLAFSFIFFAIAVAVIYSAIVARYFSWLDQRKEKGG